MEVVWRVGGGREGGTRRKGGKEEREVLEGRVEGLIPNELS